GALEPIFDRVPVREFALPDIALRPRLREWLIAPGVEFVVQAAAGCKLPFRLGRQPFAGPLRVGDRIVPRDVYGRMIVFAVDIAAGTFGMPPVRTGRPVPPL